MTTNHKFVFIIPTYNTTHVYKKCLDSVLNQTYTNWRIVYVDDASTDNTYDKVSEYIKEHKIENKTKLIKNEKNMKHAYSRYIAFKFCDDDEICCLLDGDDWLYDNLVLEKLNKFYNDNDVLVTYGNLYTYTKGKLKKYDFPDFSEECIKNKKYRFADWLSCMYLRTGFARLFKNVPIEQQQDMNGEWLKFSTDKAIMYSVLEQSNGKHKKVDFMTYVYNVDNANLYPTGPKNQKDKKLNDRRIEIMKHLRSFYVDTTCPIKTDNKQIDNTEPVKTDNEQIGITEHINLEDVMKFYENANITINKSLFNNDIQNNFYKYLQDNNIKQISLDVNLNGFNRIKKLYNLQNYNVKNKREPCLFFGMYTLKKAQKLWFHRGTKYIMFGGSDCDIRREESKKVIKYLKSRTKNTVFISISKDIYDRLNKLGLKSIYLPLDLTDYTIFKLVDVNDRGKCIYVYDGQGVIGSTKKQIYNYNLFLEIKKRLPDYRYICSSEINVKYEHMPMIYKECFIGLRLTTMDGNANTVQEFEAMGLPIVHNQSDYGLKWSNIEDIINHIKYHDNKELNDIIKFYNKNEMKMKNTKLYKTTDSVYNNKIDNMIKFYNNIKN